MSCSTALKRTHWSSHVLLRSSSQPLTHYLLTRTGPYLSSVSLVCKLDSRLFCCCAQGRVSHSFLETAHATELQSLLPHEWVVRTRIHCPLLVTSTHYLLVHRYHGTSLQHTYYCNRHFLMCRSIDGICSPPLYLLLPQTSARMTTAVLSPPSFTPPHCKFRPNLMERSREALTKARGSKQSPLQLSDEA